MSSPLRISLKAGDRIFLNGALIRVNNKVILEILNDITFILEHHVIREEEALTPFHQLYLIVQMIFLLPTKKDYLINLCQRYIGVIFGFINNQQMILALKNIEFLLDSGRFFEALKEIRNLYLRDNIDVNGNEVFSSIFQYMCQEILNHGN
ncbi:flagellar biosynthesis repressor FlbT [Candidatus Liberibacter brunswickensis]|uniref:flagellar biosynthesis repressor FlbT n=1 Tax=Candidatus Liberibacter brunswickensis TaxID=1968796 RepID=UPI002FDF6A64